jgi:uncharacterized protein (DUF362 family)
MNRLFFLNTVLNGGILAFLPIQKLFCVNKLPKVYEIAGEPDAAIRLLFSTLGGIRALISKNLSEATILIKPNLCLPHNDTKGTITSINLIKSLCKFLTEEGIGKIIIADHTLQSTEQFEKTGIVEFRNNNPKISLILANDQQYYVPRQIDGEVLKTVEVLKILDEADFFINLPTAKHHSATHVSLSIKNLMGIIWDRRVFHTETDLDQAIADLAKSIKPHLNIVDASRVLLNKGPVGPGPIENSNKIFAGTDILAVDSVVVSKYNFGGKSLSAKDIPHLFYSYKNGVGEIDSAKIEVVTLNA